VSRGLEVPDGVERAIASFLALVGKKASELDI
jgi:hypothetical protein